MPSANTARLHLLHACRPPGVARNGTSYTLNTPLMWSWKHVAGGHEQHAARRLLTPSAGMWLQPQAKEGKHIAFLTRQGRKTSSKPAHPQRWHPPRSPCMPALPLPGPQQQLQPQTQLWESPRVLQATTWATEQEKPSKAGELPTGHASYREEKSYHNGWEVTMSQGRNSSVQ